MSEVPVLPIGAVAGGATASRAWEGAVKRVAQRIIELRVGHSSPLSVNVVYQIPGEVVTPEFEGVRSGRFSRKQKRLLIEVGLPVEPTLNAETEVRHRLLEAIEPAEDFARKEAMIGDQLHELRAIVSAL